MDSRPPDAIKALLAQWVSERQQALLEKVMLAWHEGMLALAPDDALTARLQDLLGADAMPGAAAAGPDDAALAGRMDGMAGAATQGDVLRELMRALAPCAERVALFVVRQGMATLHAQHGFPEPPRPPRPVVPPADLERLIQGQTPLLEAACPAYGALLLALGAEGAAELRIMPLSLRHKTVGVLLLDSGGGPRLGQPRLARLLAHMAESRLAYIAGQKEEARGAPAPVTPSMPTQVLTDPLPDVAPKELDPKVRTNAGRSARVLVGDLELYFPDKVAEGIQRGNMYAVMREELELSRQSFIERYGAELEAQHHIFYQTVVQQLCAGDPSRLGTPPWAARN